MTGDPELPPLNAIRAFEAAARRGSFVEAAVDLNVTHWAIGKQIRLRGLGEPGQSFPDAPRPRVADPVDRLQILDRRAE